MNISAFFENGKIFGNCEHVSGIASKLALTRVNCALLPIITAGFAQSREIYAHFYRYGCLLPQIREA